MFVKLIILSFLVSCLFCSGIRLGLSGFYFVDPKAIHLFGSRGAPNLESISVLRQRARGYYFVASVMLGLFFFDAILPISIF